MPVDLLHPIPSDLIMRTIIPLLLILFGALIPGHKSESVKEIVVYGKCAFSREANVLDALRVDCHPDDNATQDRCEARGCCWMPAKDDELIPRCVFPADYVGYEIEAVHGDRHTKDATQNLVIDLRRVTPTGITNEVRKVYLEITMYQSHQG